MYLQHLSTFGFRGIGDELNLPLGLRTIFYGPNGSGKSSILQSIAWALYGDLPAFSGGVFVKEDAIVNDFQEDAQTKVDLALSTGEVISRRRQKQISTTRGTNPLTVSFSTTNPKNALEKIIGLNEEEFFAAVFLHQETIRDFLTTSPEKRSATIDRMIGTYLLRALIKSVDPKVPNKAITDAEADIEAIEARLSSATVISREVIDRKKVEIGDPATLPEKLKEISCDLLPLVEQFGLPIPESTLNELAASLDYVRRKQIDSVRKFTAQTGEMEALKQSYEQASNYNWEAVRRQRSQYGDPASLPTLLHNMLERLKPFLRQLGLPESGETLEELKKGLEEARRTQNIMVARLTQEASELSRLKDQYQQAAVIDWQSLNERKAKWGDIQTLPVLLEEIKVSLSPKMDSMGILTPQPELTALENGLAAAQHIQPGEVSRLERLASDYINLKMRYIHAKQNLVELPVVPDELLTQQEDLDKKLKNLNNLILELNKQLGERDAFREEIKKLRNEINELQDLNLRIVQDQEEVDRLDKESRQGKLYNQLLDVGLRYLEQSQTDNCPLCKQSIEDLNIVLGLIRSEIPPDLEKLQKEIQQYKDRISLQRERKSTLEGKQTQLNYKDGALAAFPSDLEQQIIQSQDDRGQAAEILANVNSQIDQVKARISMAEDSRRKMGDILEEIERSLGQKSIPDPVAELDLSILSSRERATEIKNIDFQPVVNQLVRAKQLDEMAQEEERLERQLQEVLVDVTKALGPCEESVIPELLDNAINARQQRTSDIQTVDFQPISTDLDRAFQLQKITEEEARLQKELDRVKEEVRQKLNLTNEQEALLSLLDKAIRETQSHAQKINLLDLHPIEVKLQLFRQIAEIANDEQKLKDLEQNYQTAQREKTRLNFRISKLIELRNALHDITETTKRHQEVIVSDVLSNLDIGRYYQQLDPHPAYTELQIEPEPSSSGTYKYWIRARTADFDHSAYVQARFSTAQANCAAIAIFLAVNQHLSNKLEAVLLDDPSQSMDLDHKKRLAQTLANYPRQVIVATEDPQMFSLLKDAFTSPIVYELKPWSTIGAALF